jgi:hypothetical protein
MKQALQTTRAVAASVAGLSLGAAVSLAVVSAPVAVLAVIASSLVAATVVCRFLPRPPPLPRERHDPTRFEPPRTCAR